MNGPARHPPDRRLGPGVERPVRRLGIGREQWQTALARFDDCWRANVWPEAEPTEEDDDPLLMNCRPALAAARPRFDVPLGELAL